jgi:hypothetical protein
MIINLREYEINFKNFALVLFLEMIFDRNTGKFNDCNDRYLCYQK